MKRKKLGALLVSAMLLLFAAGCGQNAVSESPSDSASPAESVSAESIAGEAESQAEESDVSTPEETQRSVLVVYYSATGSTKAVAETLAETLDADLFEVTPTEVYSSDDLNWNDAQSRVCREHDDKTLREVALVSDAADHWDRYDTVLIGYPIWWGEAAWPIDGFVKANDFTGKTVIPFCTSTSSGMGQSGTLLATMAGSGDWQEGRRFSSSAPQEEVSAWAESLEIAER